MPTDKQLMHACWDALGLVLDEMEEKSCDRVRVKILECVRSALFQEELVKPIVIHRRGRPHSEVATEAIAKAVAETTQSCDLLAKYVADKYGSSDLPS